MKDFIKSFYNNLKTYGYIKEDLKKFRYCGGNGGTHFRYFKLYFRNWLKQNPGWMPEFKDKCICGHNIIENCYIINPENGEILVLGNCCIKRFIDNKKRLCEICSKPHRNRNCNRCNVCRIGLCDKCDKQCNTKYNICYNCKFK